MIDVEWQTQSLGCLSLGRCRFFSFPTSYSERQLETLALSQWFVHEKKKKKKRNQSWVRFSTLHLHEKEMHRLFVFLLYFSWRPSPSVFFLCLALNSREGSNNRCVLLLRSEQRKGIAHCRGKCCSKLNKRKKLTLTKHLLGWVAHGFDQSLHSCS